MWQNKTGLNENTNKFIKQLANLEKKGEVDINQDPKDA